MFKQAVDPNFRTDTKHYSRVEAAKINSNELRGNLFNEFRNQFSQNISWDSEQIAKSHGIYLEFNRAKTGNEKDWMYMLRISLPGGGPITAKQWNILDRISDRYTIGPGNAYPDARPSLKITTRQNIQLHWVRKIHVVDAIRDISESGFFTMNGCGDNTRNVIGCPLSYHSTIFNANLWAQRVGRYFALPTAAYIEIFEIDPKYLRDADLENRIPGVSRFDYGQNHLNRKFKIAFSAIHYDDANKKYVPDNCVELRTNDIGIAPVIKYEGTDNSSAKVEEFQIYVGGGQGQQSGKPTISALGEPFGLFSEENLMKGLDAIVRVHKEWGDRHNRHWARLKYLVTVKGIEWLREQVRNLDRVGNINFEPPIEYDYGHIDLHLGWIKQPDTDKDSRWCYGAFIENGRIMDGSHNGHLKSMVKYLMNNYPHIELFTTPNQHLMFCNIEDGIKEQFERDMKMFGYGFRKINSSSNKNSVTDGKALVSRPYSKLRMLSGACVGRDTCRLTYTDSEKFEPYLIDELEKKWGHMTESIGVTGCEKQCYRPATKTIGWIGTGFNLYQLILMGTQDGRHQGIPLVDPDVGEQYLHFVPRKDVVTITDTLFEYYVKNRSHKEDRPGGMGYFLRRMGAKDILSYLKSNPKIVDLMKKTFKLNT
ncbi:MAG: nitrite/sulfite reductase [Candidatus Nitrosopolaris sp.]